MTEQIALFPLKAVLLPGNQLPLKIFEARYTDMVAECMREDKAFGVVQIYTGDETDYEVEIFTIGTTAMITDWQNRDDGLLGVTALGQQRFEIINTTTLNSGLLTAEVEILQDPEDEPVPEQYGYMSELLRHVTSHKPETIIGDDFNMVVYQLIYQLPIDNSLKQQLLEISDCLDRAVILHAELIRLGVIQYVKPESYTDTTN